MTPSPFSLRPEKFNQLIIPNARNIFTFFTTKIFENFLQDFFENFLKLEYGLPFCQIYLPLCLRPFPRGFFLRFFNALPLAPIYNTREVVPVLPSSPFPDRKECFFWVLVYIIFIIGSMQIALNHLIIRHIWEIAVRQEN